MGYELRRVCLLETRRLLLVMGVIFAVFLFIQYVELPYGNIVSTLFSGHRPQVAPAEIFSTGDSSSNPNASRNSMYSSNLNSTNVNDVHAVSNVTKLFDGNDSNVKDTFESESNKSSEENFDVDNDPEDEIPSKDFLEMNSSSTVQSVVSNNSNDLPASNYTSESNSSLDYNLDDGEIVSTRTLGKNGDTNQATPSVLSPSRFVSSENMGANSTTSTMPRSLNKSSTGKDAENMLRNKEKPGLLKDDRSTTMSNSSISSTPAKRWVKKPPDAVVPINDMNDMLLQSRTSYHAMKPRWPSAVDQELQNAKSLIKNAPIIQKDDKFDVNLYRNFSTFKRSYELMEQTLKVYIYSEGQRPIFHQPPLKGIYASEGWFMKLLKANKHFVTKNPKRAHLFYLPFSSRALELTLYVPNSHNRKNMLQCLSNYVDVITTKHRFWNRTGGADHFLVACHDWAPAETRERMGTCIRALCNADIKEGFKFGKDVSLPETFVRSAQNPLRELGGKPPSQRRILAFFAGNMHGYLRPILLNHWENKDPDMKIFGRIRKVKGQMTYVQYMKSSKYCICAKGFEVNSPRVVEAIFYECVPVIISDNFIPPFFETLNWESFAVFVLEKDIPNLKNILLSISKKRYLKMQQRVKQVQQHFLWHTRPVKYDIFNMILHSLWHNRVFQTLT
ncbi:probable glycosyltransferase At5g03795 isoform X1 [Olea europaea var. sylvestris]|uniref:probable glycosyltransferase At5g03795 isoform X1 n=2 Tax=Olea europaea var. sylvestris TaxID=158386 RepID=UPI000C1D8888|nr:probable glycosyltransferase At5g03795 isoform X1 [Olea europaea var. sylvestris]XP_022865338.1 probable glycosyltransferase At5g03795 isoform X1 [Olea europaea var. sylvestris]XP_022865339.1 probable glycosyltransferase At5g03795 isoform X1 [Olea europaea var. sylvestris]XP_022865340.1 probable glycosyltransferase At5g03795 isoform X1 [Olea europaea var. sylvestris]XP_022865341.1 probable glycosyltransferase At5g03795 isoform X1 [Olea europaea var. sylvestris]